ncbi:L-aspartate oxidase [Perlabentimonas gracilis]|uniref:L-aspartate oxidase n=1 Tax=Perlabentimonas gracilis TaxID=2715279 RepID=UPI001407AC73|nr:L-aspartate oxidase [Perlabentimonas gracilis]NHB67695.1 L-aspartate oxidase [Perlabentimonas gracilis]
MATYTCDYLVIGSGIAGLSFALKAAEQGTVMLISKADIEETNTRYAQGGIAAVTYEPDSVEKHIEDTLICGDGLCNKEVVRMVATEGPAQINQLIQWGVKFDKRATGEYDLAREGGHSEHRILHHKDNTGIEIQRALTSKVKDHKNIRVFERFFAVEIITQHHLGEMVTRHKTDTECYGAYVLDLRTQKVDTFLAKSTIMATGGVGNIYHTTTNPIVATGDGIAMVYRAKGKVENMEFIQFHPSSLFHPGERPSFLITEAMRGFGAILKTADGKEFMHKYDKRESLAPRDIVARAIDNEMKISGDEFVYLDVTFKDAADTKNHFPNIYEKCLSIGIDITKEMIPVVPAAHYLCGGIKVDMNGESSIKNLYAIGECSSTGLHGANRLASNSLIEAVVYADRAAKDAVAKSKNIKINNQIPAWDYEGTTHNEEMVLITQSYKEMQQVMSNYVGIVRSNLRLERALTRLGILYNETEELYKKSILTQNLCELRNMINVGYLIIKNAQNMRESRGLHYSLDYPKSKGSEF